MHAAWGGDDRLHLWGERPLAGGRLPRPRGRPPRDGRPRRHPYAVLADELPSSLQELTGVGVTATASSTETSVALPSTDTSPLPSPGLPGASDIDRGSPGELRSWRADAMSLEGAEALAVLLAVPAEPPTPVRPGGSLQAAATLATLALELVARGRVLPGLVARHGRFEARWLPILDRADRSRLAGLVPALPPSLLAVADEENRPPGSVLREIVEQLVDAACRTSLAGRRLASARTVTRGGVEGAWLVALTAPDPAVLHADVGAVQLLAKELATWHRSGQQEAPLRLTFRLAPPRDDLAAWRLEFALQATDDPSVLVSAREVWSGDSDTAAFLGRSFEDPELRLLADLGRARRLYPALDRALEDAQPGALELGVAEVVEFLRDAAPLLEQSGFGVLMPDELRHPPRLSARLRTASRQSNGDRSEGSGLLGYEGIVDYRWEVAVGDHTLTAEELHQLAALKAPLVRVRGQWVELRPDDVAAAIRLLEDGSAGQMPIAEAARIGLGVTDPGLDLEVGGVDADGPLAALLGPDTTQELSPLSTPDGLDGTLRPYQERGLSWLAFLGAVGLGGCLADDMGLGKSVQLLALLVHERSGMTRRSKHWPGPTLLVCPMSIVGNWQREAARFAPDLRVHVHHGRDRLDGDEFAMQAQRADLVLTTYSLAARDHDDLAEVSWRRIVLDEAQNIKNPAAKQSRAIRALHAPQRLALTGTPVENRLSELWSIMDFCNPGLLGSQAGFRQAFAVPIERLRDDEAAARLRRVTRPFVLRRTKIDRSIITDLPDKIEFDDGCNLTREQASLYEAVVEDMLARVESSEGIERRGLVLKTMLRLKQVCNHPAQLLGDGSRLADRSGKLTRLEGLVDEILANGERALVFTQFAAWGGRMQAHLRDRLGRDVAFLHGGVRKAERDRMVAAFQDGTGPEVFVLSLKAGGVGLNLTAANHVIHYDRWWNPAVENQATDRAFRIGQRRDVIVRRFVCTGTLEERIARLIEDKRDLADRVVGTGEGWLTDLSSDELREVVRLGADAVAE